MNFIHSWNLEEFSSDPHTLEIITSKLIQLGFKLPKDPPEKSMVQRVEYVMSRIASLQDQQQCPWVLLACNNSRILNMCSQIIPVSFALSTCYSVCSVSVDEMMQLFFSNSPVDEFDLDPIGDVLDNIKRAGLLIFKGVGDKQAGANKYSAKFATMLSLRATRNMPTIFPCLYDGKDSTLWDNTKRKIEDNLGTSSAIIIGDNISILQIKASSSYKPTFNTIG